MLAKSYFKLQDKKKKDTAGLFFIKTHGLE